MLTLIAAVAADGAIGRNGDLLWHLPGDLKHFKALTLGATVVMGRNTWLSLPRRPLPGRRNIVVSRTAGFTPEGAEVFPSLDVALDAAKDENVFLIGGGMLYGAALPMADALELTEIAAAAPDADTWFPAFDRSEWRLVAEEEHEEKGLVYRFVRYERGR